MDDKSIPKPGPSITVNVDEWLKERQAGPGGLTYPGAITKTTHPDSVQIPPSASPEEQERIKNLQNHLRQQWVEREEVAERHANLDAKRTCVHCGEMRQHYTNDYICYRCRDSLEGEGEE